MNFNKSFIKRERKILMDFALDKNSSCRFYAKHHYLSTEEVALVVNAMDFLETV